MHAQHQSLIPPITYSNGSTKMQSELETEHSCYCICCHCLLLYPVGDLNTQFVLEYTTILVSLFFTTCIDQ